MPLSNTHQIITFELLILTIIPSFVVTSYNTSSLFCNSNTVSAIKTISSANSNIISSTISGVYWMP